MLFLVAAENIRIRNQMTQKCKSWQNARTYSPVIPNPLNRSKRAFRRARPGNMTVEAAMVLPLFLYAMVNLLSLILMFQSYSTREGQLHQAGRQMALLAYGQEGGEADVELFTVSPVKALIPIAAFPTTTVVNGCVMHKWIGYDPKQTGQAAGGAKEELVYLTRSGTAYHKSRSCIYLNPSIRMMERSQAQTAVNADGSRYLPCAVCQGNTALVYVTDTGNRYHSTAACSGLKRTIESVPLSEALAMGRHACSKCGG